MTVTEIGLILICLVAGGVMKGATGAGAPILAIPAISAIADVRLAIVVMLVPTILTNVWQAWTFRKRLAGLAFLKPLLAAAAIGIMAGTWALATLPSQALTAFVCLALLAYVVLRLARPRFQLSMAAGRRLALPVGLAGGFLHGTSGLSGPVALPYLASLRLDRETFAGTVSIFFLVLGSSQTAVLLLADLVAPPDLVLSLGAVLPVVAGMALGNRLAVRVSQQTFDRCVLAVISLLAAKLALDLMIR